VVDRHCDDCAALDSYDTSTQDGGAAAVRLLPRVYLRLATGKCIDLPAPASRFLSFSLRGLRGTLLPPHATTARVVVGANPDASRASMPWLRRCRCRRSAREARHGRFPHVTHERLNASLNSVLAAVVTAVP
jgi:hypothetical protein